MIVDAHGHLYHPRWYPEKFNRFLVDDFVRKTPNANFSQSAKLIGTMLTDDTGHLTVKIMDKVGIDRRVIAIVDWGVALGEPATNIGDVHRDILGVCARFPDRLIGLAGLDPRRSEAEEILLWSLDHLGARGLKLHPTSDWSLDDERTHRLVEMVSDRRLPVLVHVGRTMPILKDQHAQPAAMLRLAKAFPGTRFIAGHSGFEQWEWFSKERELPGNLYCDISGWQDMVAGDPNYLLESLQGLCVAFPQRVCFGSDSPFFTFNLAATERSWLDLVRSCVPAGQEGMLFANGVFGD